MRFLLINSNEPDAFAALYNDGELTITYTKELSAASLDGKPHIKPPDKLIECLDKVINNCREKGIEFNSIDAVSVVTGPGSFTGIRVGLSIAKGCADALGKIIIPVDNFALTLNRAGEIENYREYCVVIPAKVPEYYFRIINNGQAMKTGFFFPEEIAAKISENTILVGNFDDDSLINLDYFSYINVKDLKSETDSMIELTLQYYKEGKVLDSGKIEPLYIKDFVARKKQT